jgi:hypothetical protein
MPAEVSDHFKTFHTFYTVDIFVNIRLAGIQSFVEAGIERIFLNLKGFSDGQVPNGDFALSTIYPYLFEPGTQLHYQDISFPRGYKNKDFTVQWLWNAAYDVKCGGLRFTSPLEFCQSSFGDFIDMLSLIHTKSIVLVHPTVTCGTSSFLTIIQYLLSNYLEIYWLIMLRLVHYFMMAHFVLQLVAYRITLKIYSVLL